MNGLDEEQRASLTCSSCNAYEEMPEPGDYRAACEWRRTRSAAGWRWAKPQTHPPVFMPRVTVYSCPRCPSVAPG